MIYNIPITLPLPLPIPWVFCNAQTRSRLPSARPTILYLSYVCIYKYIYIYVYTHVLMCINQTITLMVLCLYSFKTTKWYCPRLAGPGPHGLLARVPSPTEVCCGPPRAPEQKTSARELSRRKSGARVTRGESAAFAAGFTNDSKSTGADRPLRLSTFCFQAQTWAASSGKSRRRGRRKRSYSDIQYNIL